MLPCLGCPGWSPRSPPLHVVHGAQSANTADLLVFQWVLVPILTYGPKEYYFKCQRQRWDFGGVHGMTLLDKVRSCEIRRALNVETLLREILATLVLPCFQNAARKAGEASPAG